MLQHMLHSSDGNPGLQRQGLPRNLTSAAQLLYLAAIESRYITRGLRRPVRNPNTWFQNSKQTAVAFDDELRHRQTKGKKTSVLDRIRTAACAFANREDGRNARARATKERALAAGGMEFRSIDSTRVAKDSTTGSSLDPIAPH